MYPSAFDYYRPSSVPEVIKLLQDNPEGKILAGGHSLLPMLKLRLAAPSALIDIGNVSDLRGIRQENNAVVLGAMTTFADILHSEEIKNALPILAETANLVGDIQVRNRGTIGGTLSHADPASDFPALALALEAEMQVSGPNGERSIQAVDCFIDMFTTAMEPEEVLTEIVFPIPQGASGVAYEKFAHPASGYAIVGIGAAVTLGDDGKIGSARVAVTGACPVATRLRETENALAGQEPTDENIAAAAEKATAGLTFMGDIHAGEEYRAHLTKVFTRRALTKAVERARG